MAIALPGAPSDSQRAIAVAGNLQEAESGRLLIGARRQRELPPMTLNAGHPALILDRSPDLLVDRTHLGRGGLAAVPNRCQAKKIGRKFRPVGMKDESPPH